MKTKLFFVLVSLAATACSSETEGPLSPEEAIESFQVHPDFRVEVFAAEPYVVDPVEVVFDERGRAFAAEMRDYPEDPPKGRPPRSRIRLLEDTDGDGRVDRSFIFADNLLQATSMLPWKGGLLVTAAPDILYLKDTDGDNRADVREVLFTGFALVNPEGRITNLRFNVDNWIYASNNGQQGDITFTRRPDAAPVSVLGADFRFRLDRGEFEAASGPTQFGQAIDDFGNRFITQNTIHVRHVVLPRRYLTRNPYLTVGQAAQDISDHGRPSVPMFQLTEPQEWRKVRTQMRQERYRQNELDRVRELNPSTEIASGYITGASGGTIYSGDMFSENFLGNLFTGDVAGSLVHRDLLKRSGVTFTASRPPGEQDREFLASTDSWFRPCNFATGPDGNLYMVDIYREFIETPESIPEELKQNMDFYNGDDLGRIYRIVPKSAPPTRSARVQLDQAPSRRLVDLLSHPNAWWRFTAQRLLLERQDRSVTVELRKLALESRFPQARLHALYALEGMEALDSSLIEAALRDRHPAVRVHALRLAERFPGNLPQVLAMLDSREPEVRFQLALSLGEFVGLPGTLWVYGRGSDNTASLRQVTQGLARLVMSGADDHWLRAAVLSSEPGSSVALAEELAQGSSFFEEISDGRREFLQELSAVVGARNEQKEIIQLLRLLSGPGPLAGESWQVAGLSGLAEGLELAGAKRMRVPVAEALLNRLIAASSAEVQAPARAVARHFEMPALIASSIRQALNSRLDTAQRVLEVQTLSSGSFEQVRPAFEELLKTPLEPELLTATVHSLASFQDPPVSNLLLSNWSRLGPAGRQEVLTALLNHRNRLPDLMQALESRTIAATELDVTHRTKLLTNPDPDIVRRARKVLEEAQTGRATRYAAARFEQALAMEGHAERGRLVFQESCARCHLSRAGGRVGPDLSGVSSHTREQLLQSILEPSSYIQPGYVNYIVVAKDGSIHDGIISGETPGTLRLSNQAGQITLLRSNIERIRASEISLMPEGLEESMTAQDLADLMAFLQGAKH